MRLTIVDGRVGELTEGTADVEPLHRPPHRLPLASLTVTEGIWSLGWEQRSEGNANAVKMKVWDCELWQVRFVRINYRNVMIRMTEANMGGAYQISP